MSRYWSSQYWAALYWPGQYWHVSPVEGSLSATEASDSVLPTAYWNSHWPASYWDAHYWVTRNRILGNVEVAGDLAGLESADSSTVAGAVRIALAMAALEASDTASISGELEGAANNGEFASLEAPDTVNFRGVEPASISFGGKPSPAQIRRAASLVSQELADRCHFVIETDWSHDDEETALLLSQAA